MKLTIYYLTRYYFYETKMLQINIHQPNLKIIWGYGNERALFYLFLGNENRSFIWFQTNIFYDIMVEEPFPTRKYLSIIDFKQHKSDSIDWCREYSEQNIWAATRFLETVAKKWKLILNTRKTQLKFMGHKRGKSDRKMMYSQDRLKVSKIMERKA